MVLKLYLSIAKMDILFESDVISDGTQTSMSMIIAYMTFESDVISDGTQTM